MTEPTPTLAELTEQYRDAKRQFDAARTALADGIRTARAGGIGHAEIVRQIDHEWTGEYVRQILKGEPR
jgi:hypothetical protein